MGPRLNAPSAQFTYFDVHAHTDTPQTGPSLSRVITGCAEHVQTPLPASRPTVSGWWSLTPSAAGGTPIYLKPYWQACRPGTQLTSAESCGSNIACCCADVGGYE